MTRVSSEQINAHLESGDLIGALTTLAEAAGNIRIEMRKKLIRNALIMSTTLVVAVIGVVVGGVGVTAAHEARTAARAIVEQRTESRIVVCQNSNEGQLGARHAHTVESHDLVAAILGTNPQPSVVAAAKAFNVKHDRLIVRDYPLRDCSPKGVALFYQNGGTTTTGNRP